MILLHRVGKVAANDLKDVFTCIEKHIFVSESREGFDYGSSFSSRRKSSNKRKMKYASRNYIGEG